MEHETKESKSVTTARIEHGKPTQNPKHGQLEKSVSLAGNVFKHSCSIHCNHRLGFLVEKPLSGNRPTYFHVDFKKENKRTIKPEICT